MNNCTALVPTVRIGSFCVEGETIEIRQDVYLFAVTEERETTEAEVAELERLFAGNV